MTTFELAPMSRLVKFLTAPLFALPFVFLAASASGVRVGVGGLWGAFGWLWTTRRGIVRMYVSRTDGFVWISCGQSRPWLLTPRNPEGFAKALLPDTR